MVGIVELLALSTLGGILFVAYRNRSRRDQWHIHMTTEGPVMRRMVWETRELTPEEHKDWYSGEIW